MACSNCGHASDGDLVAMDSGEMTVGGTVSALLSLLGRQPPPVELCRPCLDHRRRVYEAETRDAELGTALIFSALAAFVASLAWYAARLGTTVELGFLAAGVGWIVGQAVRFGAGHKRGPALQVIAVAITGIALVLGAYLAEHHRLAADLASEGLPNLPLVLPVSTSFGMVVVGLTADPLVLIFGVVGLVAAYRIPAPRRLVVVGQILDKSGAARGEAR